MPFNPSALHINTVKSFIDRLQKAYKARGMTVKRSDVQEDVAKVLGFASYHELRQNVNTQPNPSQTPTTVSSTDSATLDDLFLDLGNRIINGEKFLTQEAYELVNKLANQKPSYTYLPFSSNVVPLTFQPLIDDTVQTQEQIKQLSEAFNQELLKVSDQIKQLDPENAELFITEVRDYFFGDFAFHHIYNNIERSKHDYDFMEAIAFNVTHQVNNIIPTSTIADTFSYMKHFRKEDYPSFRDNLEPQRLAVAAVLKKRKITPYDASDFTSEILPIHFKAETARPKSEEDVKNILKKFDQAFSAVRSLYQNSSDQHKAVFIEETYHYFEGPKGLFAEYTSDGGYVAEQLLTVILGDEFSSSDRKLAIDTWCDASIKEFKHKDGVYSSSDGMHN